MGLTENLRIVTRWLAEDLLAGVSDLDVYLELRERGIPMYINDRLHLKLLIFERDQCFIGSANVTEHGLGYSREPNHEIGCWATLSISDWVRVYELVEQSVLVTDAIYEHACHYVQENARSRPGLPPLHLPVPHCMEYSIHLLPATASPTEFEELYYSHDREHLNPELQRRFVHDYALYNLAPDTARGEFQQLLRTRFKHSLLVQHLVRHLQERESLRFGDVSAWLHDHCSDVPLPYRWQIKESTQILYNWLSHFYAEISWDVPGSHSQVLYWRS